MSVASLQVTKTYADGLAWTEAKMDAAMQSIQTYTQTSVVNNFNQVRKDIWGATYDFDNDGNANNTNTLYKEIWGRSYTGNTPRSLYTETFGKNASSTVRTKSFYAEAFGASPTTINTVRTNSLYNKQSASVAWNTTIALSNSVVGWTHVSASTNLSLTPEATGKYLITYQFSPDVDVQGVFTGMYAIFNRTAVATLASCFLNNDPGSGERQRQSIPTCLSYIHNFASTAAATFALYYRVNTATGTIANHRLFASASMKNSIYGQIHKI